MLAGSDTVSEAIIWDYGNINDSTHSKTGGVQHR